MKDTAGKTTIVVHILYSGHWVCILRGSCKFQFALLARFGEIRSMASAYPKMYSRSTPYGQIDKNLGASKKAAEKTNGASCEKCISRHRSLLGLVLDVCWFVFVILPGYFIHELYKKRLRQQPTKQFLLATNAFIQQLTFIVI